MFDKRLMAVCPDSRKYIVGNIVLQFMELLLNTVMIAAIALTVSKLYYREWNINNILLPACIIILTLIARIFTTRYAIRMSYLASRTVKRVMREKIYARLLRLGNVYREHASTAELVQESVEGVEQLESYFGQYVPQFFYAFIAPVFLFLLFGFGGSWKVAAVLLICVPLIPAAIMVVQKIAKKLLSKYWGQYTQLGSTFLENLQGMTTLKTYQADEYKNEQMNKESELFRKVTMKVLTMQLNSITIMDFVAYGGAGLGILLATMGFVRDEIPLANCIFMILLSADFFLPMRRLGSYFHVAMNGMAASDRIFKFLNGPEPEIKTLDVNSEDNNISMQNVSFSYDGERNVLDHINLNAGSGRFTGIVGESGSGKSTIAALIMGRYSPDSGMVRVGSTDVSGAEPGSLMKKITYVGIGSTFFKGSVRDNLIIAAEKVSDNDIWNALKQCELDEYVKEQGGLDMQLNENAGNLSGGQRQRLALARAILHDSDIYIFDEATSNIDIESEESILRQIISMAESKTVIMITHRLANVSDADMIYCLKDGQIAEKGTHSDLLDNNGVYAELWKVQQELENYGKEKLNKKEARL